MSSTGPTGRSCTCADPGALVVLSLPSLLVAMDISLLTIALPSMGEDLDASANEVLWMSDIYGLLVAGSMITLGALADRYGRKRTVLVCAAVFAVASAVGAFAPTAEVVILARAVMGIAGSGIMPAAMGLIAVLYDDEERRASAIGVYMTVFLVGMAIAPLVGGVVLEHWWWGAVFLLGVPVMLATLAIAPRVLPEAKDPDPPPLDLPGAGAGAARGQGPGPSAAGPARRGDQRRGAAAARLRAQAGGRRRPHAAGGRRARARPRRRLGVRAPAADRRAPAGRRTAVPRGPAGPHHDDPAADRADHGRHLDLRDPLPPERPRPLAPRRRGLAAAADARDDRRLERRPAARPPLGRQRTTEVSLLLMSVAFIGYAVLPDSESGLVLLAAAAACATAGIGAALPLLLDDLIGSAPPERAGSAASLAQTCNELGIALGLALLGSLGTLVYRFALDTGPDQAAAEDGIVRALLLADDSGDEGLRAAAQDAFTTAFNVVGMVGVGVMVVVLWLAVRRRERAPEAQYSREHG